MLQREKYRIKDGQTPLNGEELNARLFDLDNRIHTLEELKVSWEEAVSLVQAYGLERINGVVQPVLESANNILTDIQSTLEGLQGDQAAIQAWWDGLADTIAQLETYSQYSYLYIDAAAFGDPPDSMAPAEATYLDINDWRFDVRAFLTSRVVISKVRTPDDWDGGELIVKVAWMGADGCSVGDTVQWAIRAKVSAPGEEILNPWGTPPMVSDQVTTPGVIEECTFPAFVPLGAQAGGGYLYLMIVRGAGDAQNMTEEALLLGVTIQFQTTGQVAGW